MKKLLLLFTASTFLMALSSCENNDLLLSEKKLDSKIQKDWKIVNPYPQDSKEIWTFSNGGVSIKYTKNDSDYVINGNYSIEAKATKSYCNFSNFNYQSPISPNSHFKAEELNRRWTIVVLDGGVLYLSGVDDNGNIRSIEYIEE